MAGGGEVGRSLALGRARAEGGARPCRRGEGRRGARGAGECGGRSAGLQRAVREGPLGTCQPRTCVPRPRGSGRGPPLCGRETVRFLGRLGAGEGIMAGRGEGVS